MSEGGAGLRKVFSMLGIYYKEIMRESQEFLKNTFITHYLK